MYNLSDSISMVGLWSKESLGQSEATGATTTPVFSAFVYVFYGSTFRRFNAQRGWTGLLKRQSP